MESKTKVSILCHNRLLRESIARILGKKPDFEVLCAQGPESSSPDQVIQSKVDVVVLDSLDFLSNEATQHMGGVASSSSCVLLAVEDDCERFLAAVQKGVRAYILRDASAVDVVSAIREVAKGQAIFPPRYARVLFDFVVKHGQDLPNIPKRNCGV